ncbi:putative HTH-type transcriptional regulator GltR [Aneurinibacillus aneurinilyticus ATCC 12856]|nr:putative HTH-type transcriptional regulator GltR [Aneurinibacillus aneurinilyticus ATCC 12856]
MFTIKKNDIRINKGSNMNLEDLYTFSVVAKEQNISKAAEKLNFVQSNITVKIQRLEKEYRTQLFYRHRHGVSLTSTGKTLLGYAEKILQLMDESKKEITYPKFPTGTLTIGAMETTAAVRLPPLLSAYHKKYPAVELVLQTDSTDQLIKKVVNREIEGAFIGGEVNHPALDGIDVFEEELVIICNSNHASNIEDTDYLRRQNIIVFKSGCFYRKVLEDWLRSQGIIPEKMMELNTLEGIVGCVRAGLGISLLTKSVVDGRNQNKELVQYSLPHKEGRVTTSYVYHKDSVKTPAFHEFVNMLTSKQ